MIQDQPVDHCGLILKNNLIIITNGDYKNMLPNLL